MYPLKFIYSEKDTKFCKISTTLFLSYVVQVKSKVEISQNVVSFCGLLRIYAFIFENISMCFSKGGLISESN